MANLNSPFDIAQLSERIKRILDGGDPTKDSKISIEEVELAVKSALGQLNVANADYKSNIEKDNLILTKQKNDLDRLNLIVARQKAKIESLKLGVGDDGKFLVRFEAVPVEYDSVINKNYVNIPIVRQVFNKLKVVNNQYTRQIYFSNNRDILYVGDAKEQTRPFVPKPMGSVVKRHPAYKLDDPFYYFIEQDVLIFEKPLDWDSVYMKINVSSMIDLSTTPAEDDLAYSGLADLDITPEKYEKLLVDLVLPMFNRTQPDLTNNDLPNILNNLSVKNI